VRSALSDLSGGTYTLRVEGASSASFTVTATYWQ
jgi:hypothetical protein